MLAWSTKSISQLNVLCFCINHEIKNYPYINFITKEPLSLYAKCHLHRQNIKTRKLCSWIHASMGEKKLQENGKFCVANSLKWFSIYHLTSAFYSGHEVNKENAFSFIILYSKIHASLHFWKQPQSPDFTLYCVSIQSGYQSLISLVK